VKHILLKISLILTAAITLLSCGDQRFFEEYVSIPGAEWKASERARFEVAIEDTAAHYDFFINIRNTGAYPYSNLFMFINTYFPDGRASRDTVEIFLADAEGRWLGQGSGGIWDNRVLFRRNVLFPMSGTYRFEIEQAMRLETLPEIMDVGLRIEKKEQK
jgi:gliding motility-associated lipoprotein GldH